MQWIKKNITEGQGNVVQYGSKQFNVVQGGEMHCSEHCSAIQRFVEQCSEK